MHLVQLVRLFIISLLLINFNVFKYRAIFYSVIVFYQLKKRNSIHFGTVMLLVTYRILIERTPFFAYTTTNRITAKFMMTLMTIRWKMTIHNCN